MSSVVVFTGLKRVRQKQSKRTPPQMSPNPPPQGLITEVPVTSMHFNPEYNSPQSLKLRGIPTYPSPSLHLQVPPLLALRLGEPPHVFPVGQLEEVLRNQFAPTDLRGKFTEPYVCTYEVDIS